MKIAAIVQKIQPIGKEWAEKARERTAQLAIPPRALGRLHDISEQLCGISATLSPEVNRRAILVMAGDHGVVAEGVSAFPQEVTGEMVRNFIRGGAGINALARCAKADVIVVDMGIIPDVDTSSLEEKDRFRLCKVGRGTANLTRGQAMTREQAEMAILSGFQVASELFLKGIELIGTGDMGIGNTTPSAAIGVALTGSSVEEMVGRGTGIDDESLLKKRSIIQQAMTINRPDPSDGLDVLAKVGGFEIGGIAGCILAGAYHRRPVVIDGFISTAGALVAQALCPSVVDYLFSGHCSEEAGHRIMLQHLGLEPILDLRMRLGEGTGGALAMCVIEGAVRVFKEVLTFDDAGVSKQPR
ncbi:MAG: nicotinate-nucleotide--dimethylbenzimidazole phosphoribosyltransferase [Syntrophobacteraceae bacterium]|jgi:nicotinate-nucleotide--dimethylbenzimidazole phosphoribosyltransferase